MPGFVVDGVNEDGLEVNVTTSKENFVQNMRSPKSTLSPQSPRSVDKEEGPLDGTVDN